MMIDKHKHEIIKSNLVYYLCEFVRLKYVYNLNNIKRFKQTN